MFTINIRTPFDQSDVVPAFDVGVYKKFAAYIGRTSRWSVGDLNASGSFVLQKDGMTAYYICPRDTFIDVGVIGSTEYFTVDKTATSRLTTRRLVEAICLHTMDA